MLAAFAVGLPVVSVRSLIQRPVTIEQLRPAGDTSGQLFTEEWIKVPAPATAGLGQRSWAVVGADRLMMGSDYPFPIGDMRPRDIIREAGFDDATREAMEAGTAKSLFGL